MDKAKAITIGGIFLLLVNVADFLVNGMTLFDRFVGDLERSASKVIIDNKYKEEDNTYNSPFYRIPDHLYTDCSEVTLTYQENIEEDGFDSLSFRNQVQQSLADFISSENEKFEFVEKGCIIMTLFMNQHESPRIIDDEDLSDLGTYYKCRLQFKLYVGYEINPLAYQIANETITGLGMSEAASKNKATDKILNWLKRF